MRRTLNRDAALPLTPNPNPNPNPGSLSGEKTMDRMIRYITEEPEEDAEEELNRFKCGRDNACGHSNSSPASSPRPISPLLPHPIFPPPTTDTPTSPARC